MRIGVTEADKATESDWSPLFPNTTIQFFLFLLLNLESISKKLQSPEVASEIEAQSCDQKVAFLCTKSGCGKGAHQ